jgi:hypothetical protein
MRALLVLGPFFLLGIGLVFFIHRYFGQAITSPSTRGESGGSDVSAFSGGIGVGGDNGLASGGGDGGGH